jgi:hypothetical protein
MKLGNFRSTDNRFLTDDIVFDNFRYFLSLLTTLGINNTRDT